MYSSDSNSPQAKNPHPVTKEVIYAVSRLTKSVCLLLIFSSLLPAAKAQLTFDITSYGARGSDGVNDTTAIQSALAAASAASQAAGGARATVYFPPGRYNISTFSGIVIPSNVTLAGSTSGESVILNKSGGGLWGISTQDRTLTYNYMVVARADDTAAHPAVPNNSYLGLNYVYLKDGNDINILRSLGVPATVTASYKGLVSEVATGATLSNNSNNPGAGPLETPKKQLENDLQMNPTPALFGTILAVDSAGKVTLKDPNRFNWGFYAHTPGETLSQYYNPGSWGQQRLISGPAWVIPADKYHHDISFKNLIFETDLSDASRVHYACDMIIGFSYNVEVVDCNFRGTPGPYHIEAIRCYNVVIARNNFNLYGLESVCLDACNNITIAENVFTAMTFPNYSSYGLPPGGVNYILLDEDPMDIFILNNRFGPLTIFSGESKSGVPIFGPGGAFMKLVGNTFTGIPRTLVGSAFDNGPAIYANNRFNNCKAWIGGGALGLNIYDNLYDNPSQVRADGKGTQFYNPPGSPPSYFVKNNGISAEVWYSDRTTFNSNTDQMGRAITSMSLINVGGVVGSYGTVNAKGLPLAQSVSSVSVSSSTLGIGQKADLTVNLSAPASATYPIFLIVSGGDYRAVWFKSWIVEIPAGSQSVTLPGEVEAVMAGRCTIMAKPLAAASPAGASVDVTVFAGAVQGAAPTVSITSPVNGASFQAPANINITANASDSDGSISKVEFFSGSTKLGEDASAPYSFTASNLSAGSYSFTAHATDNSGMTTTSGAVSATVTAANQSPTVSLTAPAGGSSYTAPATISLAANASDGDGTVTRVEFFSGSTKLGEDTIAPYSLSWSGVAAGTYSFTARATDNSGATTTSGVVSVTVTVPPNQAPTVSLTSPAGGASFTAPASISLAANASDGDGTVSKVEFFSGSTKLGEDTSAPYSLSWTGVGAGSYSLTARATDNSGATTTSGAVSVTVTVPQNQAPIVSLTSPIGGTSFTAPATISLAANATDADGTVSKVEFFSGSTKLGEDTSLPYALTWSAVASGSYSITAVATDNGGATRTSAAVAITVNAPSGGTDGQGTGLKGEYFTGQNFGALVLTRIDPSVDFNWAYGAPAASMPVDNFSIRWTGKIQPRFSETYNFAMAKDDGVRLWVNGQQIINSWGYSGTAEVVGAIALVAGQQYDIKVEYFEGASNAKAQLSWSSPSQAKQIVPKSQLYPPVVMGAGTGLRAEYFTGIAFNASKLIRTDSVIDFNWAYGAPDASMTVDNFSVRWTGKVQPRYSQTYTFSMAKDDGIRLWVNGQLIIDSWGYSGTAEISGTIALVAGQLYDIKVEYYEGASVAKAQLFWSATGQAKEIVPKTQLYPN